MKSLLQGSVQLLHSQLVKVAMANEPHATVQKYIWFMSALDSVLVCTG